MVIAQTERARAAEVGYRDIVLRVKEMKVPFNSPDVADLAAQYLHEKGTKVWR